MKISTFIIFILLAAGIFFTFAQIIKESNDNIDGNYLNSSEWEEQYDYIEDINETFSPVNNALNILTNDDEKWYVKTYTTVVSLPISIGQSAIVAILQSFGFGGNIIVGFLNVMDVPLKIIYLAMVILIIWGIFKLIAFVSNKIEI